MVNKRINFSISNFSYNMYNKVNIFKDRDGFTYAHPERSCTRCLNYPCIEKMDTLFSDFAKYGCINFDDINTFRGSKRTNSPC